MFCTNCGSQFEDGNLFCPNCGSKVESVAQPIETPAPAAAPIESEPVVATPVEAEPVYATPVETEPVYATPVAEPAPAPAPQPIPVTPVQPVYAQPTPVMPVGAMGAGTNNPELAKNILIMGIVAVACACTFWFSFVGIIFGAIGLSKAKKFIEECGQLFGKAKIGKYLSLGGLIGSCVFTGWSVLYIISVIAAFVSEYA